MNSTANSKTIDGSCLCGAVSYQYRDDVKVFQYCHCSRCRKVTGSAHAANIIIDPANFQWTRGEEFVGRFELPDAKHFATSFCKKCGSNLPWRNQRGSAVIIPAGTLDEDPGIKPRQNIYYKSRAPWYVDVADLKKFDELPIKK